MKTLEYLESKAPLVMIENNYKLQVNGMDFSIGAFECEADNHFTKVLASEIQSQAVLDGVFLDINEVKQAIVTLAAECKEAYCNPLISIDQVLEMPEDPGVLYAVYADDNDFNCSVIPDGWDLKQIAVDDWLNYMPMRMGTVQDMIGDAYANVIWSAKNAFKASKLGADCETEHARQWVTNQL